MRKEKKGKKKKQKGRNKGKENVGKKEKGMQKVVLPNFSERESSFSLDL